jgi:glycosyltransferase involved in cell wall biosynthesis
MKVLFDHQAYTMQNFGGVSKYFTELMRHSNGEFVVPEILSYNDNYKNPMNYFNLGRIGNHGRFLIIDAINKRRSIDYLKTNPIDVFHPTYYDPYFLQHLGRIPYVLTIHDMIHALFPDNFRDSDEITLNTHILAENAEKIISVSENTKTDICNLLDINSNKIVVVPLAASLQRNEIKLKGLPEKYILYVGVRKVGYKNYDRFQRVMNRIISEDPSMHLVCAGGEPFEGTKNIHYVPITKNNLGCLYQQATAFVLPSKYEGFGIPLVEAMVCECPIVCSNSSSLPEVAGDAAQYFDCNSDNDMYDAIMNVTDNKTRFDLRLRGIARARHFSWTETTEKTRSVYNSII